MTIIRTAATQDNRNAAAKHITSKAVKAKRPAQVASGQIKKKKRL